MSKNLKLFTDDTSRQTYEQSQEYLEPYVGGVSSAQTSSYNTRNVGKYFIDYKRSELRLSDFDINKDIIEVEYLESPGGIGAINIDFIPTGQDIRMVGKFKLKAWSNSNAWTPIISAYSGEDNNAYRIIRNNTNTNIISLWNGAKAGGGATNVNITLNTDYEFDFNKTHYTFGNASGNLKLNYTGAENTNSFYLYGQHKVVFYYFKIYKADVLIRDLIPVRIGNVGYMYDKVSRALFGINHGSGEFIIGPDKYNPKAVMTVVYNVLSTDPTKLYFCQTYDGAVFNGAAMFDSVEIDGVEVSIADLDSASGRTLFSVGEHTVRYTLKDPTFIGIERDEQTGRPTKIGACFIGCHYITSVTIPNSVTSIGENAFLDSKLTNVTIPNGVTSIGNYAFQECTDLTSVTIPDSVTSIGEGAFAGCTGLTSITIPNSVTSIGDYAFQECTDLTSVTIPDGVTSIGAEAFAACFSLTSITIPNSVTSIGYGAFMDAGLVSITIPSSVTYVGEDALVCGNLVRATVYSNAALNGHFKNSSLEEVVLGDNITTIGDYTFQNCTNLSGITIPNSVTSIGEYAFNNCWFNSITIPDSVTNIGEYAFYESSISYIVIGDGVTEIKRYTFGSCYAIENVTLGSGITRIGENAFSDVPSGDKLICKAITPPTVDTGNQLDGFYDGIFVPAESVNAYKSASGWSYVANEIQAIPTT